MCSSGATDSESAGSLRRTRHSHGAVTVFGDCRSLMPSAETWSWIVLLVLALPATAAAGALLVRRAVGPDVLARHNDVAGFIYAVIGVVYAVLIGFTAIMVWEQFRNAQEGVEQ